MKKFYFCKILFLFVYSCSSFQDFSFNNQEEFTTKGFVQENDNVRIKKLLSEGNDLFQKQNYEEALDKIKRANSIKPTEDGLFLAGLIHLKLEELTEAKNVLSLGLEQNPNQEKILYTYSLVLTALGEKENVLKTYSKLIKIAPDNELYTFKYALSLKSLERYEESQVYLQKINPNKFTNPTQLYLHLGDVSFHLKKFSQSKEYYSKAKSIDPAVVGYEEKVNIEEHIQKGDSFVSLKKYDEAIFHYAKALEYDKKSPSLLLKLGDVYSLNNDLTKASEYLEKSLEYENSNEEVYLKLSKIYNTKGLYQKSISILQKGISVLKENSFLNYHLGLTYKKAGMNDFALLSLVDTKYKNPNLVENRILLTKTLLESNLEFETKKELEELKDLEGLDKTNLNSLENLFKQKFEKKINTKNKKPTKTRMEEFSEAEARRIEKIQNTFENFTKSGQREKCLVYLKKEWNDNWKISAIYTLETIANMYSKLGHNNLALESFLKILEKNPLSHFSYYQIGLLQLSANRTSALQNLDKTIILNNENPSNYIARGITHYKLGKREKARFDFYHALSMEPNLEIASYNIGMILYNDNMLEDAEGIFLDLTKKFPKFADPYYHLGYIYFEQKKLDLAEKYIAESLKLDRNSTTIYAYIRILEEINRQNPKREDTKLLLFSLKKELVEKFPNSPYISKVSESVLKSKNNNVVIQNYPLSDSTVSPPIFVNRSMILNYGYSVVRVNSETKEQIWRMETDVFYDSIKIGTRLYGISKNQIHQIDLETNQILWKIKTQSVLTGKLELGESIVFSGIRNDKEILYSYSFEGELQSTLDLNSKDKWALTQTGFLFVFRDTPDGMTWRIYDSKFTPISDNLTLIGVSREDTNILGVTEDCYLRKGKQVYRFLKNGSFYRSPVLDLESSSFFTLKNSLFFKQENTFYSFSPDLSRYQKEESAVSNFSDILISKEGILTRKDTTGKVLWSENILPKLSKSKPVVFSVYYKD